MTESRKKGKLEGQTFSRLTVLSEVPRPPGKKPNYGAYYLCRCSCLVEEVCRSGPLVDGTKKACKKCSSPVVDRVGKTYYWLTVLERAERPSIHSSHGGGAWWRCVCRCGRIKVAYGGQLASGSAKSCGCRRSGVRTGGLATGRVCDMVYESS